VYKKESFLAIIPARGGSKRLPRKNILDLAGKPLIEWSIEAGLKSKYIDKVVLTSEDAEILSIAKDIGVDVIDRPVQLSTDSSTSFDVVKHAVETIEKYDYIILLQPTSPLRNEKHIDEAVELLIEKNADSVVSVCEVDHSPLWSNTLPDDGSMKDFLRPEVAGKRSQDFEKYYRLNGAIYICKTKPMMNYKTLFLKDNSYAYIMETSRSVDIDTYSDYLLANLILKEYVD
jgi:CMP-N,N'-diacetyllegionaminic acid synthase